MLIGGGARGAVWQRTVARLSGRRVLVPDADELVALGAAAQAAACLCGRVSRTRSRARWEKSAGTRGRAADGAGRRRRSQRIRAAREATLALHEGG